jgi:SPP1 family predicted phage head-tail adaptor
MAGPGAGELDRRITIQALTQTKDSEGGMVDDWADVSTVWAKVRNLSGNERRLTAEGGQAAEARTEFTIRYRSGLNERMRISYGGKKYNIRHINNYAEAREFLVITCDTGLNDGR